MRVEKDGKSFEVNGIQLKAFLNAGYKIAKNNEKQVSKAKGKATDKLKQ